MFFSCGKYSAERAIGATMEQLSSIDDDRTTQNVNKTELANAVKNSIDKSLSLKTRD